MSITPDALETTTMGNAENVEKQQQQQQSQSQPQPQSPHYEPSANQEVSVAQVPAPSPTADNPGAPPETAQVQPSSPPSTVPEPSSQPLEPSPTQSQAQAAPTAANGVTEQNGVSATAQETSTGSSDVTATSPTSGSAASSSSTTSASSEQTKPAFNATAKPWYPSSSSTTKEGEGGAAAATTGSGSVGSTTLNASAKPWQPTFFASPTTPAGGKPGMGLAGGKHSQQPMSQLQADLLREKEERQRWQQQQQALFQGGPGTPVGAAAGGGRGALPGVGGLAPPNLPQQGRGGGGGRGGGSRGPAIFADAQMLMRSQAPLLPTRPGPQASRGPGAAPGALPGSNPESPIFMAAKDLGAGGMLAGGYQGGNKGRGPQPPQINRAEQLQIQSQLEREIEATAAFQQLAQLHEHRGSGSGGGAGAGAADPQQQLLQMARRQAEQEKKMQQLNEFNRLQKEMAEHQQRQQQAGGVDMSLLPRAPPGNMGRGAGGASGGGGNLIAQQLKAAQQQQQQQQSRLHAQQQLEMLTRLQRQTSSQKRMQQQMEQQLEQHILQQQQQQWGMSPTRGSASGGLGLGLGGGGGNSLLSDDDPEKQLNELRKITQQRQQERQQQLLLQQALLLQQQGTSNNNKPANKADILPSSLQRAGVNQADLLFADFASSLSATTTGDHNANNNSAQARSQLLSLLQGFGAGGLDQNLLDDPADNEVGGLGSLGGAPFAGQAAGAGAAGGMMMRFTSGAPGAGNTKPIGGSADSPSGASKGLFGGFDVEDFMRQMQQGPPPEVLDMSPPLAAQLGGSPEDEQQLIFAVVQFLQDPSINPFQGSVPIERLQNAVRLSHNDLYANVVGRHHNSWRSFLERYSPQMVHLIPIEDGKWKVRWEGHPQWEEGDRMEAASRNSKEQHLLDCLVSYLKLVPDNSCKVDEFVEMYPSLNQDPEIPLPPRGDLVRFIRRHSDCLSYDADSLSIQLIG